MTYQLVTVAKALSGELLGDGKLKITGVSSNSNAIVPGDIFVAIKGGKINGAQFVDVAFKKGALAAVVADSEVLKGRAGIVVQNTRRALSQIAHLLSGKPSDKMTVFGVTGTNGKTTINWMLYNALTNVGRRVLRMGTLGSFCPADPKSIFQKEINEPDTLTTPDCITVQKTFQAAKKNQVTHAVLECSSHALDQDRLSDIGFDFGIFTNLTRDHLDYHETMENYFLAKSRLFELVAKGKKEKKAGIVNIDSEYGEKLISMFPRLPWIRYGRDKNADVQIVSFQQNYTGSELTLRLPNAIERTIRTHFIGAHNAYNLAAAAGALYACGISAELFFDALEQTPPVPGRLEPLNVGQSFGVYIDYAHTPDALENVLSTLRPLVQGKLSVLFGCGGDRDKGKRPTMMKIAESLADTVVVTSDNPRTEDPGAIITDILAGSSDPKKCYANADRRAAIAHLLSQSSGGDIVLIAGKGHEDYQIIGTTKHHFSDKEEAAAALSLRAA